MWVGGRWGWGNKEEMFKDSGESLKILLERRGKKSKQKATRES